MRNRAAPSPAMCRPRSCTMPGQTIVIVGHSERRDAHREEDAAVRAKASAALASGLRVILCVGESLAVREAGGAIEAVSAQLDGSLPPVPAEAVAYEPIWAIGTGRDPVDGRHSGDARGTAGAA